VRWKVRLMAAARTLHDCADDVAEELGADKTPAEKEQIKKSVREIAERLRQAKRRAAAAGKDPDAEIARLVAQDAGEARIKAAKARKDAAINIIKGDAARAQKAELVAQGLRRDRSLVAILNGAYGGWKSGRNSAATRRQALGGGWISGMLAEFHEKLPHVVKMLQRPRDNAPFFYDVVREWRKPGSTKSKEARLTAEIFSKYAEAARLAYNKAGGNAGKIPDWGGPQAHDAGKLIKAGDEQWITDIYAEMDHDRSFGALTTEAEAKEILADSYLTITTGVPATPTARERGAFVGAGGSFDPHRVFHFKDANAWIRYAEKYGRGNVVTGLMDHLKSMARRTALMEKLGTNPPRMMEHLIEDTRREIRDSKMSGEKKQKELGRLTSLNKDSFVSRAWAVASGDVDRPGNLSQARRWSALRQIQSMASLGLSLPSQFSDLLTYAQAMRWQGRGLLQGYADSLGSLLQGRPPAEVRRIAMLMGVGHETFLGEIHAGYAAEDAAFGILSRWQNAFFKWNGTNWWTDNLTTSFSAMTSVDMAEQSRTAWSALNIGYRTTLAEYGIGEADWNKVRNMVTKEGDYSFVWPELAGDHELEMKLRGFIIDTAQFAVIQGDDRTKQWTTGGQRSGTHLGEAIRSMMQFKGFPIAYTQKILGPMFRGQPGRRDLAAIPHLIAMSLVFGYISSTTKDIMKNKTPKDPLAYATWLAALTQSGGAGLYGDFFFGNADRFGGGLLSDLAGPTISDIANLGTLVMEDRDRLWQLATGELKNGNKLWGDLFKFGLDNTPYINLHFLRAGLDLAILNSFQEWLSPGTFRRREREMKKTYGQGYLIDPLLVQHGAR
jgi:hypothetical protein